MKFTKIVAACGLALASMTASAASVPGVSGSTVIFFSGASAPDGFIADVLAENANAMLTNATVIVEAGKLPSDSKFKYKAWVGDANNIPGITNGTKITLIKRSAGGSAFGVNPVAKAEAIKSLDVNSSACTFGTDNGVDFYACPLVGDDAAKTGVVPDFGVSDVEPAMFLNPLNVESTGTALTAAELGNLENKAVNQQLFGFSVTDSVDANVHIGRAQYGAMMAGKLRTWDQVDGTDAPVIVCRRPNGSGTQASFNWFLSGFPCNSASSGWVNTPAANVTASEVTQFGGNGGTSAAPELILPDGSSVGAKAKAFTVVENSGSSGARACMSAAYFGLDYTTEGASGKYYTVKFSLVGNTNVSGVTANGNSADAVPATIVANAANPNATAPFRGAPSKAIATLSLDSYGKLAKAFSYTATTGDKFDVTANAGLNNSKIGWNFRMLDGAGVYDIASQQCTEGPCTGIAPSKANMLNGRYDFVMELSMNNPVSLSGVKRDFFNDLRNRLGSIQYTSSSSKGLAFATLPDVASYNDNPNFVSKYSRSGNTCSPMVAFPSL